MGITVADIEQKEFTFKGNGYDPYDVDQYLDQICDEMVAMQDKIDQLTAELAQAKEQAANAAKAVQPIPQQVVKAEPETSKAAGTLESILLSAQRISDEAVQQAKEKAAQIVQEAQDKASGIVEDAQGEKKSIESSLGSIKQALSDYKERFLSLMNEQKALIDAEDELFGGK